MTFVKTPLLWDVVSQLLKSLNCCRRVRLFIGLLIFVAMKCGSRWEASSPLASGTCLPVESTWKLSARFNSSVSGCSSSAPGTQTSLSMVSTQNRVETNYDCHLQHTLTSYEWTAKWTSHHRREVWQRAALARQVSTGGVLVASSCDSGGGVPWQEVRIRNYSD